MPNIVTINQGNFCMPQSDVRIVIKTHKHLFPRDHLFPVNVVTIREWNADHI